jgi:hypothetical protein
MKTIIKEVNVYKFEELSEEAKNNVREWIFQDGYFWADEAWQSAKKFGEEFNVKVYEGNFSPYASINYSTGQIDDNILNLSGTRLRTYLINNHYSLFFERKPQGEYIYNHETKRGSYKKRSRVIWQETSCPFIGYCMDEDILQPMREFIASPDKNTTFEDLISECMNAWIKSAENDCEGQESEEYLEEHCEANGYEFTENGKIF